MTLFRRCLSNGPAGSALLHTILPLQVQKIRVAPPPPAARRSQELTQPWHSLLLPPPVT
jgi:hypothetical protein